MMSMRTTIKTATYDNARAAKAARMEIVIHQTPADKRNEIEKATDAFAIRLKNKYGIDFSIDIIESRQN